MPILRSLTNKDLEHLSQNTKRDNIVLSFYFGVKIGVNFRAKLNSLMSGGIKEAKKSGRWNKKEMKKIIEMSNKLKKEISLLRLPEKTRTIVGFADAGGSPKIYRLPIYMRSDFIVESNAFIRPLKEATDMFSRYIIAEIDRNQADFYTVFLGGIEKESGAIRDDVPKKIKRANADDWMGRRQTRITRHIEDHLEQHLKRVSEKLKDLFAKNGIEHLVIGAHGELMPKILKTLDKTSCEKLIGSFGIPHYTDGNYIKEKSMELINKHEEKKEIKIVRELLDGANERKWRSVLGADAVLENLYQHNLHEIIIENSWKSPGYLCTSCHYVTSLENICPRCESKTERIKDMADEIMEEASRNGVSVKSLFHPHKEFDRYGIGAFLKTKP